MITKKQQKSTRCTQTQAYDVELIFRKIWALVSYFSEVIFISYEFSKFKLFFEKKRKIRILNSEGHLSAHDWTWEIRSLAGETHGQQ